MENKIDQYIEKSNEFAKPILNHLRQLIHQACPAIEETIKWGMPAFYFKGPVCNIAAFKSHVVFGFWKASLINDPNNFLKPRANDGGDAMGHLGKITKLSDIPPDKILIEFINQAIQLNENNIKVQKKLPFKKEILETPSDLLEALIKNSEANNTFKKFSMSHQREYIEWITEAKTAITRQRRLLTTIEWLEEGKNRNWKYVSKK